MAIAETICTFALGQFGVDRVDMLFRLVVDQTSDHSQRVLRLLEQCNRKAWRALEIALAGESLWTRLDRGDSRALRDQVRAFLDRVPLPELTARPEFRTRCLKDIRAALKTGALLGELVAGDLAEQAGDMARFGNPQAILAAEHEALQRLAAEVTKAGFESLGWLLAQPASPGQSIIVVAARYYFRRAVETNAELFRGLQFTAVESMSQAQEDGFRQLDECVTTAANRLDEALNEVATEILGEIAAVRSDVQSAHDSVKKVGDSVDAVHDSVKGVEDLVRGVHEGALEIQLTVEQAQAAAVAVHGAVEAHAADTARRLDELQARMGQLLETLDMRHLPVESRHSLSIRTDRERDLVRDLLLQVRSLPPEARAERPELVSDVGKLQIAVGDFSGAGFTFLTAASLATTDTDRAEAHHNAYRAKLEQGDYPAALQELKQAVALGPDRFTPFPLDKYLPDRILGAGGFGVTFLCRHRLTGALVAVKAIHDGGLDRDPGAVLQEAMTLDGMKHRAIIGLRDCGFADEIGRRRPYLVMEYFDGPTLQTFVERDGPIPLNDLLPLAEMLAEALAAAHKGGVLHRDVKPANVLVNQVDGSPSGWEVRLIDFGLAMRSDVLAASLSTDRGLSTHGASIAGTLDYAAPEQLGKLPGVKVGPPADVYGFARTVCFALFATTEPTNRHYKMLPEAMADLIGRCLSRDPKERPQEFADVLNTLGQIRRRAPRTTYQGRWPANSAGSPGSRWGNAKDAVTKAVGALFTTSPPPPAKPADPPKSRPVTNPPPREAAVPPPPAKPADPPKSRPVRAPTPREGVVLEEPPPRARPSAARRFARDEDEPPIARTRSRRRPAPAPTPAASGDRVTHAIMAILLGFLGIHKYMQGNAGNGTIRLVLFLFLCGPLTAVVGVIEGIQYLTMSNEQYARDYLERKKDWF